MSKSLYYVPSSLVQNKYCIVSFKKKKSGTQHTMPPYSIVHHLLPPRHCWSDSGFYLTPTLVTVRNGFPILIN